MESSKKGKTSPTKKTTEAKQVAKKKSTPKKTTTKKATAKKTSTVRTTAKKPAAPKSVKKEQPKIKEEIVNQEKSDSTEEKIKKVGDRLSEAADKGVDVLKEVFEKVKDFSVDAAELTRLKVDIHRLKGDRERILTVMGEKLWELRDSEKLGELRTLFEEDFKKLKSLNDEIEMKENTASKISL
jgi:hypothetical protein